MNTFLEELSLVAQAVEDTVWAGLATAQTVSSASAPPCWNPSSSACLARAASKSRFADLTRSTDD